MLPKLFTKAVILFSIIFSMFIYFLLNIQIFLFDAFSL